MARYTDIIAAALSQQGKPYDWATPANPATVNPSSFDCSGLMMWAAYQSGTKPTPIHQTMSMYAQFRAAGLTVPVEQATAPALIFYGVGRSPAAIHHVALLVAPGQVVEAPDYGIPVRTRTFNPTDPEVMALAGVFQGTSGTGVLITGDPSPPIDPKKLKVPLTVAQRTTIINYAFKHAGSGGAQDVAAALGLPLRLPWNITHEVSNKADVTQLVTTGKGQYDASMIAGYTAYVNGVLTHTPGSDDTYNGVNIPGVSDVAGFIRLITSGSTWVRVAEFGVGALLLGVAVNATLRRR